MLVPKWIWKSGSFISWEYANTHIMCQGLHYGAGVFEGIRFYKTDKGGAIFRLDDHLDRLFYSARVLAMEVPFSRDDITVAIKELIHENKMEVGYIRPIIWYAEEKLGLGLLGRKVEIAILIFPWEKQKRGPLKVKISPYMRIHPKTTDVEAKLVGTYNNSQLALLDAQKEGYDDALLLDFKGDVAEASSSNIFIVSPSNTIYTPPPGSILPGITRDTIIKIARDNSYDIREEDFEVKDLLESREVFLCGTAMEIMPVLSVDEHYVRNFHYLINLVPGNITKHLSKLYSEVVLGNVARYQNWLTYA